MSLLKLLLLSIIDFAEVMASSVNKQFAISLIMLKV